jgi:hypothetical protein
VAQIRAQGVGDAQPGGDHTRDVGCRGADALDRIGDPQHARHPFGVFRAPCGEHRHRPQAPQQVAGAAVEPDHLVGDLVVVEEDGRVGEIHHQLRGVLQLDEQVFDGMWRLVTHAAALPMMS